VTRPGGGVGIIFGCLRIYQAKEEEAWHELKTQKKGNSFLRAGKKFESDEETGYWTLFRHDVV
jgi:hypothetical protein